MGTQRLVSVKYLFEEVNIAWNIIFYYLVQGILKISR